MKKSISEVTGTIVLALVMIVVMVTISAVFAWLGWNHGVVPVSGGRLHEISIPTAWFLMMFFSCIGQHFKQAKADK